MKIKYIILFSLIILILSIDNILYKRKYTPLKTILFNLSNKKVFKLNPKEDYYKKLYSDLKHMRLNISPELFNVITFFIAIISIIVVVAFSYLYKFNLFLNLEELNIVSEMLGKPELSQINLYPSFKLILNTALIMLILPRQILKLCVKFKLLLEENEILMLQTYTLMMIKAGIPVQKILVSLFRRSTMFKSILEKSINSFSNNPELSLKTARDNTSNRGFEKIIRTLEQALNNDREVSLIFLKNHRKLTKELNSLEKIRKNSTKSIISVALLIIPLIILLFIAGYPLINYTLKMLSSSPV